MINFFTKWLNSPLHKQIICNIPLYLVQKTGSPITRHFLILRCPRVYNINKFWHLQYYYFLTDDYLIFTSVICSIYKNAVLKQMYLQYLYFLRQKSQQKPGKAHTKIAADAKNPRKASKNTYKNRRGRKKPKKSQQKPAKTHIIHI